MRLFVAVNFCGEVKGKISEIQNSLSRFCVGRSVSEENLHLTLVFIGETENVQGIKDAMNAVDTPATTLLFDKIERFRSQGKQTVWLGAAPSKELDGIYQTLFSTLKEKGFCLEERSFCPHITLFRQADMDEKEWKKFAFLPVSVEVCHISLMLSQNIQGKQVYMELYSKVLPLE